MADITKTAGTVILTHQAITHPGSAAGGAQSVVNELAATLFLFHASIEAVANTNPGRFLVQASGSASGDEDWATISTFDVSNGTAATEAMTATEPSSETVLAVASTTGFAALDQLYIQDAGTLADSEWALCEQIVTNTSIDVIRGITNAKDSSDVIWNNAEIFVATYDLTAISRLEVLFLHEGATGANAHVKALMVLGTEIV